MSDSTLCILNLNERFRVNLNSHLSDEVIAVLWSFQVMVEEHFFWGMMLERFIVNPKLAFAVMEFPLVVKIVRPIINSVIVKRAKSQGLGHHSQTELATLMRNDLHALSNYLGEKPYFGGETPCEADCALFGSLAQAMWCLPGTWFERLVHTELDNLGAYCNRMKETLWPDWDKHLKP